MLPPHQISELKRAIEESSDRVISAVVENKGRFAGIEAQLERQANELATLRQLALQLRPITPIDGDVRNGATTIASDPRATEGWPVHRHENINDAAVQARLDAPIAPTEPVTPAPAAADPTATATATTSNTRSDGETVIGKL